VDVAHGSVSWSPDGRRLAYLSGLFEGRAARTLLIWSADTGQTRSFSLPFKPVSRSLQPTTWSADGRWVYVAERSNDTIRDSLHRIDTGTGAVETVLPPGSGAFDAKDTNTLLSRLGGWSPDGHLVYKAVRLGGFSEQVVSRIVEHRVADHAERDLFRTDPSERWLFTSWQVSPSLDGSQLALALVSKGRNRIVVVPAGDGPAKTVVELQQSQAPLIRWMPDGRSLVLLRWKGGEVGVCDTATGAMTKLELPVEAVSDLAVSPDGKEIAYVAGGQPGKEGVWMLENFLPPKQGSTTPPKK
jgi:Tol biopolymer transport system component